jgi:hypothetical protein
MSEEDQESVETTEEVETVETVELSDDDKDRIIADLRKENAAKRVKNRDLDTELNEFRSWKANQMSDLDKANARVAELEKVQRDAETDKLQRKVAKAVGLSYSLADRIRGDSEAEMLEDAKSLLKEAGKKTGGLIDRGPSGGPVGGENPDKDKGDWLRGALSRTIYNQNS